MDQAQRKDDGIFGTNATRDKVIVVIALVVLALLWHMYNKGDFKMEKLDNRPRWMLGSLRDDTGATNPASLF